MNEQFLNLVGVVVDSIYAISFIVLTIAMYRFSKQQGLDNGKKQRDFFKIQLFDKRYSVYEAIEGAVALIERKDFSSLILSEGIDPNLISKRLIDAQENLHKASCLSQALFSKDVSDKIFQIEARYKVLVDEHFKIFKQYVMPSTKLNHEREMYVRIFSKQMFETDPVEIENLNKELQEICPHTYYTITDFNLKVADFTHLVNELKVLEDFDKYMILGEIDKN